MRPSGAGVDGGAAVWGRPRGIAVIAGQGAEQIRCERCRGEAGMPASTARGWYLRHVESSPDLTLVGGGSTGDYLDLCP